MSFRALLFKYMWKRQERTLYFKDGLLLLVLLLDSEFILTRWANNPREMKSFKYRNELTRYLLSSHLVSLHCKTAIKSFLSIQYNVEQQNYLTNTIVQICRCCETTSGISKVPIQSFHVSFALQEYINE